MATISSDSLAGAHARRLLPTVIALPLALGWLRLQGEYAGLYRTEHGVALFAACTVVGLAGLAWHGAIVLERTEREQAHAQQELATFFEQTMDLVAVADLDGYFRRLTPSWETTLGWPIAELLARPWLDVVHPDDVEPTRAAATGLAAGLPVVRFENRYRSRDGSYRWISWKVPAPVPGSTTLYCTGRDITESKRADEALARLNEQLAERHRAALAANQELEAFSYSVSHDLRAPLRHAGGFVQLLAKHAGSTLDDKSRRYLKTISDAVTKMGRLIDDLLAFSRVGRAELNAAPIAMSDVVEAVRREVMASAPDRAIAWDVRPLPDAWGDSALVRQVWTNLLANAVKYTRPRSDARIEVGTVPVDGGITAYFVRDNGVGFDMRYVAKLFGVFQRLHSAQDFEGTGVGLANVKRIVDRHGGRVWAEGVVGEGATFYFTLPPPGKDPT